MPFDPVTAQSAVAQIASKRGKDRLDAQQAVALRAFSAKLADRSNTPTNVLLIGDSITEGENNATTANRWVSQFRDGLRSKYPTLGIPGGKGFIPPYRDSPSMPQPSTLSRALTKGVAGQGLGARISVLTTAADTQKFTVTNVTAVDVVYAQIGSGGGAFTVAYSADGGTTWSSESSALSSDGASVFTDMLLSRVTFPRRGNYIVRLTCTIGGAQIGGIIEYDGDEGTVASEGTTGKGIRVYEAGHYGSTTTQQAAYAYMTRQARIVAPSLVVIALATNDYAASTDPATTKTNLETIIANVKTGVTQAGVPAASFVLFAYNQRTGSFTYPWSQYVDAMWQIAAADDHVVVCDLTTRIAAVSDNSLGLFADAVHPNYKGHGVYANALMEFLTAGAAQAGSQRHGNDQHTPSFGMALPTLGYKAGAYIGSAAPAGNITTQPVNGDLRLTPLIIDTGSASVAFDRLSTYVATAGGTGAKARLVIYADTGFGYPGALVHDSGQLAAETSTTEVLEALSGFALAPGVYWAGVVTQGTPSPAPIYVGVTGRSPFVARQNVQAGSGSATSYNTTSVTSAPPDPFPSTPTVTSSGAEALLRVA